MSVCPQSFLYLAWYMTMSILGHYNNFFFAAHLLDIAMGFKTLRTILSSVTHNGKQVKQTFLRGQTVLTLLYNLLPYPLSLSLPPPPLSLSLSVSLSL